MTSSWSSADKIVLLQALRKHGSSDLMKLGENLPFKNVTEIRNVITTYQNLARKQIKGEMEDKTQVSPLDEWATFLRQIKLDYTNMMPFQRALKYIALFEKRTEINVNLTECYEYLSDLSNKAVHKDLSQRSHDFMRICMADLAKTIKKRDNKAELEFLSNISRKSLRPCASYSRKVLKRSAADDPDLNPLKIPRKLLSKNVEKQMSNSLIIPECNK